ncbi:MAG: hypothetical protein ABSE46_24415 [Terracidiphilus sp.]
MNSPISKSYNGNPPVHRRQSEGAWAFQAPETSLAIKLASATGG